MAATALPGSGADTLFSRLADGNRRDLARCISELNALSPAGRRLRDLADAAEGAGGLVVAVTGPPGAGKSTLIASLCEHLARAGQRTAALLIDPSSPLSGGAVLGDRIRFGTGAAGRPDIFIRSLAGRLDGVLTPNLRAITQVARLGGFSIVIVETVGSGQSDVDVVRMVDHTIWAVPPGLGDGVQVLKAGIQEMADAFVVTKSDREGADQLMRQLSSIARTPGGVRRPVLRTCATTGEGIPELARHICDLLDPASATGPRA